VGNGGGEGVGEGVGLGVVVVVNVTPLVVAAPHPDTNATSRETARRLRICLTCLSPALLYRPRHMMRVICEAGRLATHLVLR
jgi:hypothetical protein